ncbi:DegQ family serine endoprotease [Lichenifustis flavocetrariae]|uniref:Probable periplasmic serine endoprotease DegP-like n=1 Tax=Lichenifustis flavocetrariae TaxID=2949735 RepID=A0AA41Z545_9HYPH|nr:DegQ family serine endoprotease [Lichenifustis flavocetrariae]MCW6510465.1 DegQ family serine endoprotease [Lichenifustis flavocetrariae]
MTPESVSHPPQARHRKQIFRMRVRAVAALVGLGVSLASPLAAVTPAAAKGTESLADLADSVVDAVVNISAAQVVGDNGAKPSLKTMPQLPPGTPFQDFFEEFFKRQLQGKKEPGAPDAPPKSRRSASLGSGFIIDPSGIVITNNHVIEGANEITVILTDGRKLKAELLGTDAKVDVAVLKVSSDKPLKSVKFGDSEKMRVGDAVMAVGNPFGLGGTVTAGIVSARNRNIDSGPYDDYIQTDAAINKGNSGGPLFNMAGEVIGINTAILSPSGGSIGIGFATPSETVIPIIDQLREFHEARRGWLGVRIQPVDETIADSLSLGTPHGALIAGVDDNGPAKPAGLLAGDVIVTFDGKEVKTSRDLPRLVAATAVGKEVSVSVIRDGKPQNVTVKLGRLEDGEKQASAETKTPADAVPPAPSSAFGMQLSLLTDDVRKKFAIKDSVQGVAVASVDAGSPAGGKAINAGDVVVEVNQQKVTTPKDIADRVQSLKEAGRHSVLLLVANPQGEVRFVAIGLD